MQLSKEIFVRLKQTVDIFAPLSDGELLAILKLAVSESFSDGEVVFKEGSRGDKMYIILNGTIRISKYIGAKKEEVLAKLTTGVFGEMGVIDQSPRSASATVEGGPAVLLVINEKLLSEKNVLLAYKLFRSFSVTLAQRLRDTNKKLQDATAGDRNTSDQLKALMKKKLDKGTSLQGANLRGADLSQVFMNNAHLENAILIGAKMAETKCKQTIFSNAKFVNSEFKSITFDNANFDGADFTGSNFENVEFISCNLKGAKFFGADLTNAHGLDVASLPGNSKGGNKKPANPKKK